MLTYRPPSVRISKDVCTPLIEKGVWEELPQTAASRCLLISDRRDSVYSYSCVSKSPGIHHAVQSSAMAKWVSSSLMTK